MKKILGFVPGFRTGTRWKSVVASVYYLFSLIEVINGIGIFLVIDAIPFLIFYGIKAFKTRKKDAITFTIISLLILCFGIKLLPNTETQQSTNSQKIAKTTITNKKSVSVAKINKKILIANNTTQNQSNTTENVVKNQIQQENITQTSPTNKSIQSNSTTQQSQKSDNVSVSAKVSNPSPKDNSEETLIVNGPSGASFKAICHYSSKDTEYDGTVGTPLKFRIGRAKEGFTVNIDIDVIFNNNTYNTETSFTAQ